MLQAAAGLKSTNATCRKALPSAYMYFVMWHAVWLRVPPLLLEWDLCFVNTNLLQSGPAREQETPIHSHL